MWMLLGSPSRCLAIPCYHVKIMYTSATVMVDRVGRTCAVLVSDLEVVHCTTALGLSISYVKVTASQHNADCAEGFLLKTGDAGIPSETELDLQHSPASTNLHVAQMALRRQQCVQLQLCR